MAEVDRGEYTNPFNDGETRVYDIVNEYDWTSAPAGSDLRKETPNAYVTAYKMDFSQLQQFIDGYINIATVKNRAEQTGRSVGLQFYKDLYKSGKVLADLHSRTPFVRMWAGVRHYSECLVKHIDRNNFLQKNKHFIKYKD